MTPLFAPKPAPRALGFGPGYGEQMQWRHGWGGQGPAPAAPTPYWNRPQGPAWQRGSWPNAPGNPPGFGYLPVYGTLPQQPFGLAFGGFDPFAQQDITRSGFAPTWGGPMAR